MLNKACPTCYEPLYEKEAKVVCVRCKTNYILVDSPSEIPRSQKSPENQSTSQSAQNSIGALDFSSLPDPLAKSAKVMLTKLDELNAKLEEATDPKEISEISSSIRTLIDSLRSMMN